MMGMSALWRRGRGLGSTTSSNSLKASCESTPGKSSSMEKITDY